MTALHDDAVEALTRWAADGQAALRQAFLGFLAARPDAMARSCAPGHLTASTVVLDAATEHVLLTLHPRVGRWLQLGGHCEDDPSLAGAALREATEESGIAGLVLGAPPRVDHGVFDTTRRRVCRKRHDQRGGAGNAETGYIAR